MILWAVALAVVGTKLWRTVVIPGCGTIGNAALGAILIASLGTLLFVCPRLRINRVLGVFLVLSLISLIYNGFALHEDAFQRLAYFALMLALVSPLATNPVLNECRRKMWTVLMVGLRLIVAVSLVMYIGWEHHHESGDYQFHGPACHPMMLGIIAAVVFLDAAWRLLSPMAKKRKDWVICALLLGAGALVMIATGSRGALLAAVGGMVPLVWAIRRSRIKLLWSFIAVAGLGTAIVVSGLNTFEGMKVKTNIALENGSITYSRDRIWNARLEEFKSRPLFGIGFATTTQVGQADSPVAHTREPGSAWLNVLSATGIAGFLLILLFNYRLIRRAWRSWRNDPFSTGLVFASLLMALWIHGCFEGWILYAGSTTFLIYWLLGAQIMQLPAASTNDSGK